MDRKRAEKVSKALADGTRLSILDAICARKEMICGDIARLEGITPATVSHHLKVLADAGLIEFSARVHTSAVAPQAGRSNNICDFWVA